MASFGLILIKSKRMEQKYIIGDLVKYKVGGLEFIAEITNTSKYGYCFKGVSDDISGTLCKEFAKDIPLTSEILEKNGWERNGGQYSFTFKPYVGYKVELIGFFIEMFKDEHDMLKYKYFQIFLENKNIYGCFYVHQLQHLFFGLGLNSEMEV